MGDIKEVVLSLKVDSSGALNSLREFIRTTDGVAATTTKTTSALGGMVKGLLAIGTVYKAYDFGRDALNMAAAAERSGRIFNMAFGSMVEESRKWAASVSGSLKVHQSDVEKTAASFKTLFDNMGLDARQSVEMAKGLTRLGTELEIVYGLAEGEGASRLHAGIMGMGRSLQSLNIVINDTMVQEYGLRQGWIQQGQKLSEAGQAAARYNLIMEQSEKVHKNLGEATKGYSEQLRRLETNWGEVKETIGKALMPSMTKAIEDTNTWFQENEKQVKGWAETAVWAIGMVVKGYALYCDTMEKVINVDREVRKARGNPYNENLGPDIYDYSFRRPDLEAREILFGTPNPVGPVGPLKTNVDRLNETMEQIRQRNVANGEGAAATGTAPGYQQNYVANTGQAEQVLKQLRIERELLGMTNLEREKSIALREAEIDKTNGLAYAIEAEVEALERTRRLRDIADGIGESFGRAFEDIALRARDAREAIRAFALEVIRMVMHKTVTEPMTDWISGAIMSGIGGVAGGTAAYPNEAGRSYATGYHSGGVVGFDAASMRYVAESLFACAPRLHSGLAPDEYPAILQYGERVQSRGEVAAQNQAPRLPTKWELHVHNQSGQPLDIQGGDIQVDQGRMTATVIINDLKSHGPIARALRRMR
jgi:hypothetical protein